jgi:predicted Zn-dependent peptidase
VHVKWDAEVSPRLVVGYHTPAMQPGTKDTAVTLLLPELLTSRSAPLYQKLRYQKQTVTDFNVLDGRELLQATDPHLLLLNSELILDRFRSQGQQYVNDVQADVIAGVDALNHFSRQADARRTLEVIKSKFRNDLLASFDSTPAIAEQFAWFYRFNRDSNVFDILVASVDSLKPADIDAYAARYFSAQRRIVTTLWQESAKTAEVRP